MREPSRSLCVVICFSSSRAAKSRACFAARSGSSSRPSRAPSASSGEKRIETNSSTPARCARARNGNRRKSDFGKTESRRRYMGNAITNAIKNPTYPNEWTNWRVSRSRPSMSAAFVKSKTVTSSLSGCFSNRLSRTAAGARRFTFCRNRTGSIDSSPLSIPLKKNETIQQQKMMKPIIMPQRCFDPMFLECRCRLFSPAELPRFFCVRRAAR